MHADEVTTASSGPPPATGAWRPGDPPGHRQFVTLFAEADGPLRLELGGTLSPVVVAYETWGADRARSNAVLVAHALTGDSHAAGPPGPGEQEQPVTSDVALERNTKVIRTYVEALPWKRGWRLFIDFEPDGKKPVDLRAVLQLRGQTLTETWTGVFRP